MAFFTKNGRPCACTETSHVGFLSWMEPYCKADSWFKFKLRLKLMSHEPKLWFRSRKPQPVCVCVWGGRKSALASRQP
jgi:hypothetical protein